DKTGATERTRTRRGRDQAWRNASHDWPRVAGPLLAGGELPDGRTDLSLGQPAVARAVALGAHQTASAGPLGYVPGPQSRLRTPQPVDPRHGRPRALRRRPGTWRAGDPRERVPRGHLQRGLPAGHP